MYLTQSIRDLLCYLFPQLSSQDFPRIDHTTIPSLWLEQWRQQYFHIASQYILDCEYRDWANCFDLKLNLLHVNHCQPIAIDATLDEIYDFLDHLTSEILSFDPPQDSEKPLFQIHNEENNFLDDEYPFEETTAFEFSHIIIENLLNAILRQGINVIHIDYLHKFQLILYRGAETSFEDLATLLYKVYHSDSVRLYCASTYYHQQFPHLIGKL